MTARILSTHGNVIATDFRPRRLSDISVRMTTETLYCDGRVTLVRATIQVGDEPPSCTHVLGDLAAGRIVQL